MYREGDTVEVLVDSAYKHEVGTVKQVLAHLLYLRFADGSEAVFALHEVRPSQQKLDVEPKPLVVAHTTEPVHLLNEWVVDVDGVRRARFVGPNAVFRAAREANRWRKELEG